jgi:hypothetical protein
VFQMPLGSSLGAAARPFAAALATWRKLSYRESNCECGESVAVRMTIRGTFTRFWRAIRRAWRSHDDAVVGIPGRDALDRPLGAMQAAAATADLLRVVFASHGSDPDLSVRILHQLLRADLLFVYAPSRLLVEIERIKWLLWHG